MTTNTIPVLTRAEQDTWEIDKQYYLKMGYPVEVAEQYAYDHLYSAKKGLQS